MPLVALPFILQPGVEKKEATRSTQTVSEYFSALYETAKRPEMFKPAVFIFIMQAAPSMGSTGFYYYTNHLNMDKDVMAILNAVTQVCGLVGMFLYYKFFIDVQPRSVMFWGVL